MCVCVCACLVFAGDFEFEELRYQQPILGPIIFGVFIMVRYCRLGGSLLDLVLPTHVPAVIATQLAVFVLLNMFIGTPHAGQWLCQASSPVHHPHHVDLRHSHYQRCLL